MTPIEQILASHFGGILAGGIAVYVAAIPILRGIAKRIKEKKEEAIDNLKKHGDGKSLNASDVISIVSELAKIRNHYDAKERHSTVLFISATTFVGSSLLGVAANMGFLESGGLTNSVLSLAAVGVLTSGCIVFVFAPILAWWYIKNP